MVDIKKYGRGGLRLRGEIYPLYFSVDSGACPVEDTSENVITVKANMRDSKQMKPGEDELNRVFYTTLFQLGRLTTFWILKITGQKQLSQGPQYSSCFSGIN